jgi:hypothetical protein
METNKNKYEHGKIYRICDSGYTKFYYGSTIQPLAVRMGGHRAHFKRFQSGGCTHGTIFDLFQEFGVESCKIELVETFPCDSKDELLKREGFYIQSNPCINKQIAGRSRSEYWKFYHSTCRNAILARQRQRRIENADAIKDYYRSNIDKFKQRRKIYNETHKDNIKIRCKAYREQHQEEKKAMDKHYRETHKEEIKQWKQTPIVCEVCGSCITQSVKARHERSQKHQQALKQQTELEIEP